MSDEIVRVEPQAIEIQPPQGMAVDRAPADVLAEARNAAKALNDVLANKKKKVMLNNEQYLEFEDWQTLGHFYGVTAGSDGDPEPVTIGEVTGFKASSVAYRHGQVISRATQYCMSDEPNWSRKPLFQLSSMAQTRANAKVLRNVLAWVVVLAGYRPTPAEELPDAQTLPNRPTPQRAQPAPMTAPPSPSVGEVVGQIEKLAPRKSKKANGRDYMVFTLNGQSVFVWDEKLYPFLIANENKQIAAILETKPGSNGGTLSSLISCRAYEPETPKQEQLDRDRILDEDIPF